MGKKNNHKPNQYNKPAQHKTAQPVPAQPVKTEQPSQPELDDDQKVEVLIKQEELQSVETSELEPESEAALQEATRNKDLAAYWEHVKELHQKVQTLQTQAAEEKKEAETFSKEVEALKSGIDEEQAALKKKWEEYNLKNREITAREIALDTNDYTEVVKKMLDRLKASEENVFKETGDILTRLTALQTKNINEAIELEEKKAALKKEQETLTWEKKKFIVNKELEEEEQRERVKAQFENDLKIKTAQYDRLVRNLAQLEEENNQLKQLFDDFENAFGSHDPKHILQQYSGWATENENLKIELNERPHKNELNAKLAQIDKLKAQVEEYEGKINKKEMLELERWLTNTDSYIIDLNGYKTQLDSAAVREESHKRIIEDLKATINQLKGESVKKADAFEYARKCDDDKNDLGFNPLQTKTDLPGSLHELTGYVQQWMANEPKTRLYYSQDTIRIFLAGLNMSAISILQGISGTGKTSLPREFAKALLTDQRYTGIDGDNQTKAAYRICAIQSGWRDNMDLLGHYNSFEQKYNETVFFKALYTANLPKYRDTLFLIILDEMNLSRPEHYFADFLSLIEQSARERFVNLSNTPQEAWPALIKGGKLAVPDNVRFIGTANHDETTLEFAPKTYDRANLMEMPPNHSESSDLGKPAKRFNVTYSWLNQRFNAAEQKHEAAYQTFRSFIHSKAIKTLMEEKGIGTGNRLEGQAKKFISVFIESGAGHEKEKDLAKAADHLITSRLFRSLRNRYDLDKTNLNNFLNEYGRLFIDTFKETPDFAIDLLNAEMNKK